MAHAPLPQSSGSAIQRPPMHDVGSWRQAPMQEFRATLRRRGSVRCARLAILCQQNRTPIGLAWISLCTTNATSSFAFR